MESRAGSTLLSDEAHPPFPNPGAHVEFYKLFKRESDEYDSDFIKKYDDEANTTLIFAGLFSAVTSAFIIDVQTQLQPDYTQMSYALLTIIANTSLGKIPTGPDAVFPQWNGPDPTVIHVQSILYASLSASLLAAFVAMLGKQWINRFAQVEIRGSVADRSRHRVRKFNGMVAWRFDLVMESLPVMLQLALFLLGYALSNYLFFLNKTIAGVTIGFTAFGLLFYLLIVSSATLSYTCPFQTPLSLVIRFMIRFDDEHKKYLKKCKEWIGHIFYWTRRLPRPGPSGPSGPGTLGGGDVHDHIELTVVGPLGQQPPLGYKGADGDSYMLDSDCIARMFEISTDTDVIQANMKFIPEIVWHSGIRTTPLERLYSAMLECFDSSTGRLVVIPKLRNQAYLGAKALLHLVIQRQCFGHGSDKTVFESISARHQVMGSVVYRGDSDLESTLTIIDHTLNRVGPIHWTNFSPTHTHLAWMAHTLLFRAWDSLRKGTILPDDIREFVAHCLSQKPLPPVHIIADCLLIIDLASGVRADIRDLFTIDKTGHFKDILQRPNVDGKLEAHLSGFCEKFVEAIQDASSSTTKIDSALEVVAIFTSIRTLSAFRKSCHLLHTTTNSPVTSAYTQEKKWQTARYIMRGLYRLRNEFTPWTGDPRDILDFLDHHFCLATQGGENKDEPILHALCALAYTNDPTTIEALKQFDPTKPTFVRGVCDALQANRPPDIRASALHFIALIGDKWFNAAHTMDSDQMRRLCADWADIVNRAPKSDVKKHVLAAFSNMINSPQWRPHMVTDKWKLLEWFAEAPDDSEPLKRCLDNPELTDAISKVGDPAVMNTWLKILWSKHEDLIPEVRAKMKIVTKEIVEGKKADLDLCLSFVDSELREAEGALAKQDQSSVDPAVAALRAKVNDLQQTKAALVVLKGS